MHDTCSSTKELSSIGIWYFSVQFLNLNHWHINSANHWQLCTLSLTLLIFDKATHWLCSNDRLTLLHTHCHTLPLLYIESDITTVQTDTATHWHCYTLTLLHTDIATHWHCNTLKLLSTLTLLHTDIIHQHCYILTLLLTDTGTHFHYYLLTLLHTDIVVHWHCYKLTLLHCVTDTHYYTISLIHTDTYRYMAEILLIRHNTLSNQSKNTMTQSD